MMGTWFYHKRTRTAVSVFGSLFNNIHVLRTNSNGEVMSQVKVPLSYAPKRNFISRIEGMVNGEEAERKVALKLPRMSFEITSLVYDATRQLPKVNNIAKTLEGTVESKKKIYTSTPYNITFQLNVYAKSQDDALQIVEQILPFFTPQYTVSIRPFSDISTLTEDVPITLSAVTMSDDFEGVIEQRRTIIYSLDFDMKINYYGPINTGPLIRDVRNNFYLMNTDLTETYLKTLQITPDPSTVSVDSDYGFIETTVDSA